MIAVLYYNKNKLKMKNEFSSLSFQNINGLILLDQIRSIDKSRLVSQLGTINEPTQYDLCNRLQEMFSY